MRFFLILSLSIALLGPYQVAIATSGSSNAALNSSEIDKALESLVSIINIGNRFNEIEQREYKLRGESCFRLPTNRSFACFNEKKDESMYVATNAVGYSPGQITRMSQRKIYDLRQLGLSPQDISQRIRARLGNDAPSRVFGGCCEGAEF